MTKEELKVWQTQNQRDELALEMFAAWVNCPVDKLPPEMKGHTCPATMDAWRRVAIAAINFLNTDDDDWECVLQEAQNAADEGYHS